VKRVRTHREIAHIKLQPSDTGHTLRLLLIPGARLILLRQNRSALLINAKSGSVRELGEGAYFQ
jgi:hypothetical protein